MKLLSSYSIAFIEYFFSTAEFSIDSSRKLKLQQLVSESNENAQKVCVPKKAQSFEFRNVLFEIVDIEKYRID